MTATNPLAEQLIATSLDYVTARRAFGIAVDEARRAGWPDEKVCRMTGLSLRRIEAVAGRRQGSRTDGWIQLTPSAHTAAA